MAKTTIQVAAETREKLRDIRITKRETYDEILNRLMRNGRRPLLLQF
jgi:hypothetical protein